MSDRTGGCLTGCLITVILLLILLMMGIGLYEAGLCCNCG